MHVYLAKEILGKEKGQSWLYCFRNKAKKKWNLLVFLRDLSNVLPVIFCPMIISDSVSLSIFS